MMLPDVFYQFITWPDRSELINCEITEGTAHGRERNVDDTEGTG